MEFRQFLAAKCSWRAFAIGSLILAGWFACITAATVGCVLTALYFDAHNNPDMALLFALMCIVLPLASNGLIAEVLRRKNRTATAFSLKVLFLCYAMLIISLIPDSKIGNSLLMFCGAIMFIYIVVKIAELSFEYRDHVRTEKALYFEELKSLEKAFHTPND